MLCANKSIRLASFAIAIGCVFTSTVSSARDEIRDSVVKLHVTQRSPNWQCPWMKDNPVELSGSGVIIDGNRILTNAHVVLHASQILLQADQSNVKIPGDVQFIAPDLDLAVVTARDKSFFKNRKPLDLATGIPHLKETVNVYGYPKGGDQLSVTEGIVSRIEYATTEFGGAILRIQIDAALNPGNSGGPAIINGKIAGLAFGGFYQADNIGYLIAAEDIRYFLDDIADGIYNGKPNLHDVVLLNASNSTLRENLGLKGNMDGILVRDRLTSSEKCPLKRWDVLMAIGDHPIDRMGLVRVSDEFRLDFSYFIPKLAVNGKVPMAILRDGRTQYLDVPVSAKPDHLMPFVANGKPRYFIHGPMVFMPMTQELANNLSTPEGEYFLRYCINPILSRQYDVQRFPDEELVVLGQRLFPHDISKGYEHNAFALVETINKVKVKNFNHAVKLIRDARGKYLTIGLCGRYNLLVFNRQELLDVTEEILVDEGIRNQYSEDVKTIWENNSTKEKITY